MKSWQPFFNGSISVISFYIMKNNIQISIPNLCSENWGEMQPHGCGRFCNSCQKTVTDFTRMSDDDFISHFQNTKATSCARFTERQLALKIPAKIKPFLPFWKMSKYVAASMIAAAGLSGKVFGQKNVIVHNPIQLDTAKQIDTRIQEDKTITIRGKVLDENGEGLPGASVAIQNTNYGTMTDFDGNFELNFSDSFKKNGHVEVTVLYMSYMKKKMIVNISNPPHFINLKLEIDDNRVLTGDVIIIKATRLKRFKWWFKNNFL